MKWIILTANVCSVIVVVLFWSSTQLFQTVKWYWPGYVTQDTYTHDEVIKLMGTLIDTAKDKAYANYSMVILVLTLLIVLNAVLNFVDQFVCKKKRSSDIS